MTIIVTGGAGFIGSNFVFHMLKEHPDYRIVCLDKLTYAGNLSTLAPVMDNPNFRFVKARHLPTARRVYKLFEEEQPDIVVNFAAESHVDRSIEDPGVFLQTNIMGTQAHDGRLPQVRRQALSSGVHRRGVRRPAPGPARPVLHRGDADPHLQPLLQLQGRRRPAGAGLSPDLRPAGDHHAAAPTTTGPITSPRS